MVCASPAASRPGRVSKFFLAVLLFGAPFEHARRRTPFGSLLASKVRGTRALCHHGAPGPRCREANRRSASLHYAGSTRPCPTVTVTFLVSPVWFSLAHEQGSRHVRATPLSLASGPPPASTKIMWLPSLSSESSRAYSVYRHPSGCLSRKYFCQDDADFSLGWVLVLGEHSAIAWALMLPAILQSAPRRACSTGAPAISSKFCRRSRDSTAAAIILASTVSARGI